MGNKVNLAVVLFCLSLISCVAKNTEIAVSPNKQGYNDYSTDKQSIVKDLESPDPIFWSLKFVRSHGAASEENYYIQLVIERNYVEPIQNVLMTDGLQLSVESMTFLFSTADTVKEKLVQASGIASLKFTGLTKDLLEKIALTKSPIRVQINGEDRVIKGYLLPDTQKALRNLLELKSVREPAPSPTLDLGPSPTIEPEVATPEASPSTPATSLEPSPMISTSPLPETSVQPSP